MSASLQADNDDDQVSIRKPEPDLERKDCVKCCGALNQSIRSLLLRLLAFPQPRLRCLADNASGWVVADGTSQHLDRDREQIMTSDGVEYDG